MVFAISKEDQKKVNDIRYTSHSRPLICLAGPALKDPFTWGKVDMSAMARCLLVLCKQIYAIFLKEDRLLHISSACYICKHNEDFPM